MSITGILSILSMITYVLWIGIGIYVIIKSRRMFRQMDALIYDMEKDLYRDQLRR